MKNALVNILLVEDNPGDVILTKEAFAENKLRNEIHVASDGAEALAYLRREAGYESTPRPDIILLDLNLPKLGGREVLKAIKSDPKLKSIPVVILTTSADEVDICEAYRAHANCFITKPVDLDQFLKAIQTVHSFWIDIVKLPPAVETEVNHE
ncbi:response regulator [Cerasicoccus maritimus]|uniref:response regulator n=1 Tax=Cerasicoccus maritimus TaxID=490089 RepID=UPI0028525527|nr:response regulator [Cerasicoccus maritimus]